MRQNPNTRRSRGRGGRKPGNSRNQVFDSNGPGARVRGNSAQIYEKYQQLARDASLSGDRVAAENYYQHAEHYFRLLEPAALNRSGQDESQQRNDNSAQNDGTDQNDGTAQNDRAPQNDRTAQNGAAPNADAAESSEAVVITEAAPQPEPEQDSQPVSEHAPESVAALIEAVEQGSAGQKNRAESKAPNRGANNEDDAKPARRTRSRRANGRSAPDKGAEVESPEDDSEPASEDTNPVST